MNFGPPSKFGGHSGPGIHFGDLPMPDSKSTHQITPGNQLSAEKSKNDVWPTPEIWGSQRAAGTFWSFGNAKFELYA